jgi:outer membrane lipoprotein-sorting protein
MTTLLRALAFVIVACAPAFARAADPATVEDLMRGFASVKSSRADFVEKKFLSTLTQPLESSGELIYAAPSHLERRTVKPKPETLIVDGDTLTIERAGTKRSISLASFPEVSAFTDSIRETLAGDLVALRRNYRVEFDGTTQPWRLTLLPSDPKVAALVSRVTLTGRDRHIESIEILQADGNRSVASLVPRLDAR